MIKTLTNQKTQKAVIAVMAVFVFLFAVLAIHDAVVATGTGYYFNLTTGTLSRSIWNYIVDLALAAVIAIAALLPAIIMKSEPSDVALFFLANVAVSVYIRPDTILQGFLGNYVPSPQDSVNSLWEVMPLWFILFFVVFMVYSLLAQKSSYRLAIICVAVSVLFFLLAILLPVYRHYFLWLMAYVLLISLLKQFPALDVSGKLSLGFVFFLCGVWRLYLVMATYHL